MKSIRKALLLWLCVGLSIGIAAVGALLYVQAKAEANQIFDYQMKQLAASLPTQPFAPVAPGRNAPPDVARDIVIQIWDGRGLRIYHSHERLALPQRAELGFATIDTGDGPWRVYSTQHGNTVVQVAQPLSARRELAADTALRTIKPLLLLFPFLGALVWLTVTAGLLPIGRVAREVQARDADSLAPIGAGALPQEIRPLTDALNDLLARLDHALHVQRAFVADAAHELRSPLTALKLQIQLAERAGNETERSAAFAELRQGFERATRLVQQLLTLARQEPGAAADVQEEIDLDALARRVVSDLTPAAQDKGIDLGVAESGTGGGAGVTGDPEALRILLNNLVENAIRYTPQDGRVTVGVRRSGDRLALTVEDSGPGIPPAELDRVFDRFYRVPGTGVPGSGLGLAIVQQVAERHGAEVSLQNLQGGLLATVEFAAAAH
ncbi:ATP-binding protein [Noviherbaspirillum sp. CPCC 100848]|uniref:histidine kinase n=1 Tax=Noviherbaspirillum album TaxID=3080276 RepID=A0ABU6JGH6_9BURK|nr:ATP-binding protein [Noviherbaspirillum sp. CPCC 100848]MEC4722586.1 ATP-binding protein [Noviherbaspirillum sp. CPCC 100848]